MDCPNCGDEALPFAVPDELRAYAPGDADAAAICATCLSLRPSDEPPGEGPDFSRVSREFPGRPDAAIPMALLVGLLSSLALYREEIDELAAHAERAGADPLLVLDRLATDSDLDPAIDLSRRRRQLEQLLR